MKYKKEVYLSHIICNGLVSRSKFDAWKKGKKDFGYWGKITPTIFKNRLNSFDSIRDEEFGPYILDKDGLFIYDKDEKSFYTYKFHNHEYNIENENEFFKELKKISEDVKVFSIRAQLYCDNNEDFDPRKGSNGGAYGFSASIEYRVSDSGSIVYWDQMNQIETDTELWYCETTCEFTESYNSKARGDDGTIIFPHPDNKMYTISYKRKGELICTLQEAEEYKNKYIKEMESSVD